MSSKCIRIFSLLLVVCILVSTFSIVALASYSDILNKPWTCYPEFLNAYGTVGDSMDNTFSSWTTLAGTNLATWLTNSDLMRAMYYFQWESSKGESAPANLFVPVKISSGSLDWTSLTYDLATGDYKSAALAVITWISDPGDYYGLEPGTKFSFHFVASCVGPAASNGVAGYYFRNNISLIDSIYLVYIDSNGDVQRITSSIDFSNTSASDAYTDITVSFTLPEHTYSDCMLQIALSPTLTNYFYTGECLFCISIGGSHTEFYVSGHDTVTSSDISSVDSAVASLRAEFLAHKDEVAAELNVIANQLDQIGATQDQIETYLSKVVSELNGFGTDVDTALAYLNGISQNSATMVQALNTVSSLLSATNADIRQILLELLEMDVDADTIVKHLTSIATNCKNMDNDMDAIQSYFEDQVTYLRKINRWLSDSYDLLDDVSNYFDDTVSYLISIDGSLDSLSQYLNTLDTYLSSIATNSETTSTWLEGIYNTLLALDTGADSAAAALEYLMNMDNSLVFISQSLAKLEELTGTSNESLCEVVSYLVSIDASGASAAAYLQYININVADIKDNTDDIVDLIATSNTSIKQISSSLNAIIAKLGGQQGNYLYAILNNLVAQGTNLESVLALLGTISESSDATALNTAAMTALLESLLESLQQVELDNIERNKRLTAIEELLEDFEINIQQDIDKFYSENDKKSLGGLLSSIVSRLSSLIDFCGDVFGNMLTAIPDLIGGFNESLSFWGTEEVYEYSPYQIAYYSSSGGEDYTNSNSAVQTLFTEAERYLGYPYVWGGASPETSFDCSGYVSYVLDNSGVYPTSRLTAQGLYNICTPIDPSEAMPGDLIFFTGTYDTTDAVTHIGFFAGDGQMLHCGDPIQYTSCETAYWTTHFYAYGRLPYNDVTDTAETEK